jgi:NADH-quinone oxidoreductase subunit A
MDGDARVPGQCSERAASSARAGVVGCCHASVSGAIVAANPANDASRRIRLRRPAMNPYVVFLIYMLAILGFVAVTLLLNRMLGPKPASSAMKLEPFECGATPVDVRNVKAVPIKYYAVAIIFILFDLETVFLFIWALGAQPVTGFMLATFAIFMFLLVLILLYVYKARLLEAVSE